jgi:uncharacterized protein (DUF302 family)
MTEPLAFQVKVSDPYEAAVDKVVAALKSEGFGVLTRIDVKATMKEKLDAEFRPYAILGACNPPLAHKALETLPEVGVMLPCNVTVEEWEDGSRVSIANPAAMIGVGGLDQHEALREVMDEARARLMRVADALEA